MVNRKRNYTMHFLLLAVLVSVALACVNYLALTYRTRVDLTADKRFTLSEGTQRLFETLTEPVVATYYIDEEPPPKRINLERDVRDKLQELSVSSGGKLTFSIERITNSGAADKREELAKKNIIDRVDVISSGSEGDATARGFQGYFSSVEVKYGLAEPVVINGVVNLVDKFDEFQEHRVDTLEFDICFAILQMRSKFIRLPTRRMVKAAPHPITFHYAVSEQMPAKNPKLGETIYEALQELAQGSGGNAKLERQVIPFNQPIRENQLFLSRLTMTTDEETVDPKDPSRRGNKYYYTVVQIQYDGKIYPVFDFRDQTSVESVLSRLDEPLYELIRPRTKLGFVLPPVPTHGQPPQQNPGAPPNGPYLPLFGFVRDHLGYESAWVDLNGQRRIPQDLACLMVYEPNRLSERELYEIDRYLAEGGNVVMFYQGWSTTLQVTGAQRFRDNQPLTKVESKPFFDDWAANLGVEFSQDMLVDRGGRLAPYKELMQQGRLDVMPTELPLAVVIEARDVNGNSVFARNIADMPLPLAVALKLNNEKIDALQLTRTDIVSLKDDIYRFIPQNPSLPEFPLGLSMKRSEGIEEDPSASPGESIRLQKLADPALVVTHLHGKFPSYWAKDGRKVPAWENPSAEPDPLAGHEPPPVNSKAGALIVCGSAGTLTIDYLKGLGFEHAQGVAVPRGVNFFRNAAEAFIYGEDLVRLRARTGVAPRISGDLPDSRRLFWIIMCVAGMPIALLLAGVGRMLLKARSRQEYEAALKANQTQ